jgi:hypothetical protein
MSKEIKQIEWRWEFGLYAPFCPYCDEFAYEKDHCVFCRQPYKWVDGEHKPVKVEVGEYTVFQNTNNHISIYKDGRMVMHSACSRKLTEDELKEEVNFYERMKADRFFEIEADEMEKRGEL